MAYKFAELMDKMWKSNEDPIFPSAFKKQIAEFAPQFTGYNQQDSHELLAYVLDALHEDLNKPEHRTYDEVTLKVTYTENVKHPT